MGYLRQFNALSSAPSNVLNTISLSTISTVSQDPCVATRVASFKKESKVPILLLAKLNRGPGKRIEDDHRPMLADLRESGDIERDADLVPFLFREELYKPESEPLRETELNVAKQRNGLTGSTDLVWLCEFAIVEDRAGSREPGP